MPADIERMFSVREMPWHRDATVLDDYPQSFAEARTLAGLDWDPVPFPVAADALMTAEEFRKRAREIIITTMNHEEATDRLTSLWEESLLLPAPSQPDMPPALASLGAGATLTVTGGSARSAWRRIARSDTGATLSYQKSSYHIIPNSAFGEIIDAILGTEAGAVRLETGGCLSGGARVWMLARLNEPHQVQARGRTDSSMTFPYLGITSDHTGNASLAARLTQVRIICGNTFNLAEAEGKRTGAVFTFSHRGEWRDRIDEAREALQFARNEAREYTEAMSDLLGITVTPAQEQLWLREFIPAPPDGLVSDRVARNIEEARAAVQGFLDGVTVEGAGIRGTAYGLVQAAGEYADHVRAFRSWESKLNRNLLSVQPLKAKAATLAREAALA
jgi:phage/plasmid-like protein (TIGR03299 family)